MTNNPQPEEQIKKAVEEGFNESEQALKEGLDYESPHKPQPTLNCHYTCHKTGKKDKFLHNVDDNLKSSCCQAPTETIIGDEGTNYFTCSKCDKPCNIYISPKFAKRIKKMEASGMLNPDCVCTEDGKGNPSGYSFSGTPCPVHTLEDSVKNAVDDSILLQQIQLRVWEYMSLPKKKRDGVNMAMDILEIVRGNAKIDKLVGGE